MQKNVFLRCKKSCVAVLTIILLFSQNIYSATGSLWGKKDLRVTKTKWFDLIYPPESQALAAIMYENADKIYEEVNLQYNLEPSFRMPVVITPGVDRLNAFWTVAPYNHIVIYDTSISQVGELSTYSETLLSVFRHELTHAVTNNMKNKFWNGVTRLFGDPAVLGMLDVSTGMGEGATLTSESAGGEGRLNDEYSKQAVKQAKLEGKFPSYYDVQGASDNYPYGTEYYFNGAFHQWLQDKYGMEAYAKFWYSVVNVQQAFINTSFKKAFGISIKKAWAQFESEYQVPEEEEYYSKTLVYNGGGVYHSLVISGDKLYWIDSSCNKIQYIPVSQLNSEKIRPKTLFTFNNAEEINFSADGRYLAITYYSGNGAGTSSRVKIYDLKTKRFFAVKEKGLKNAAILQKDSDYYLISNKYVSPNNHIILQKLVLEESEGSGKIITAEKFWDKVQPVNSYAFEFCNMPDGKFAYIKKAGMNYSICVENLENDNQDFAEYALGTERMVISSLWADDEKLYFSWTEPGTMPRLGFLNLQTGIVSLSSADFSGGLYEPVVHPEHSEVIFAGHFYNSNKIFKADLDEAADGEELECKLINREEETGAIGEDLQSSMEYTKYNSFDYVKKGIFIPFSLYETEYFGSNSAYTSETANYIMGATYITAAPWTNGENNLYTVTGGWNYLNNSVGLEFIANLGTDTNLFSSTLDIKNEFSGNGWKLSSGAITTQSVISFGKISYLSIANQISGKLGHQDARIADLTILDEFKFWLPRYFNCCKAENNDIYSSLSDIFTLSYSNVHKHSAARYDKAGITASLSFEYRNDRNITEDSAITYIDWFNIYLSAKAYIPGWFPTKINLAVIPGASIFGYAPTANYAGRSIMDLKTETVLYDYEIMKAIPFVSCLYLNDIYLSAGYAFTLGAGEMTKFGFQLPYLPEYISGTINGKACVLDSVYLKTSIEFTPNIGLFANAAYKYSFFTMLSYTLHSSDNLIQPISLHLGFQANF